SVKTTFRKSTIFDAVRGLATVRNVSSEIVDQGRLWCGVYFFDETIGEHGVDVLRAQIREAILEHMPRAPVLPVATAGSAALRQQLARQRGSEHRRRSTSWASRICVVRRRRGSFRCTGGRCGSA